MICQNLFSNGVIIIINFVRLAEEATNGDPRSPDARTMTRISEAAFGMDDYWRIVDVLHQR